MQVTDSNFHKVLFIHSVCHPDHACDLCGGLISQGFIIKAGGQRKLLCPICFDMTYLELEDYPPPLPPKHTVIILPRWLLVCLCVLGSLTLVTLISEIWYEEGTLFARLFTSIAHLLK